MCQYIKLLSIWVVKAWFVGKMSLWVKDKEEVLEISMF